MIRRQYWEWENQHHKKCYFHNFLHSTESDTEVQEQLQRHKATLGKSKRKHTFNVKWHCAKQYNMFVLRWS